MNNSNIQYQSYLNKIFIVFVLLVFIQNGYSQDNYYDDNFYISHHTPNVSFASPEATAFGKYVDIPISLYTGVPNISVPIYEIVTSNISIPISLSYHSSGIKVEEVASWVGLGWSLNAGGRISRSVKGIPDDVETILGITDECGIAPNYPNAGYLYSGDIISNFCDGSGTLSREQYWYLSHGALDGEPDIFSYNFLNYTGKFILDHNGEVNFIQKNDFKIEYSKNSDGLIEKFIVTTENGIKITFEDTDNTIRIPSSFNTFYLFGYTVGDSFFEYPTSYISSWQMSSIQFPNAQGQIDFSYANEEVYTIKRHREEYRVYQPGNNWDRNFCNDMYIFESKRLNSITWDNGKLEFEANHTREDYDLYYFNGNKRDSKALTTINLLDHQDNLIQSFSFSYSYFYSTTVDDTEQGYLEGYSKRLRLDNLNKTNNSSEIIDVYSFEYNTATMPHRFSYEQDYWGYYNANFTNGLNPHKTLIPNLYEFPCDEGINDIYNEKYLGPFSIFLRTNFTNYLYHTSGSSNDSGKANRDPNPNVIEACMLKKIIYPSGGIAEFTYEPNVFYLDEQNIIGEMQLYMIVWYMMVV